MTMELRPRATEIADQSRLLLAAGGYGGFSYADVADRVHVGKASRPAKAQAAIKQLTTPV